MGAMLCTDEAALAITPGMHGTTFGGGPLACAAAIAVIDTIRRDSLLDHIKAVGEYFRDCLLRLQSKHIDLILEVRGRGLMIGMEMVNADLAQRVAASMLEEKIIVNRTSESVLRFLPPFILQREHVDTAIEALDRTLEQGRLSRVAVASGKEFHE